MIIKFRSCKIASTYVKTCKNTEKYEFLLNKLLKVQSLAKINILTMTLTFLYLAKIASKIKQLAKTTGKYEFPLKLLDVRFNPLLKSIL